MGWVFFVVLINRSLENWKLHFSFFWWFFKVLQGSIESSLLIIKILITNTGHFSNPSLCPAAVVLESYKIWDTICIRIVLNKVLLMYPFFSGKKYLFTKLCQFYILYISLHRTIHQKQNRIENSANHQFIFFLQFFHQQFLNFPTRF